MGARSFDDEIAQVPSRYGADWYFAPNIVIKSIFLKELLLQLFLNL